MRALPLLAALVLLPAAAGGADLSPEMVTRCKLATALVRVVDQAEGTAFHIGGGVFLTNRHVVEDAADGARIELVLNSGTKDQKLLKAQLARHGEKLDLAILKVDETGLPPALEIGDASSLAETMSVATFGFPFGSGLAVGKSGFPNVSVIMGRITALRQSEGALEAIQVDATVSPGNSGGPLVDMQGRVIGVVQEYVPGAALTFAIPADRIRKFLFGTGIVLRATPPQLTPGAPSTLSVELLNAKKGAAEPRVTLRLSAFAQDQREYTLAPAGADRYEASVPLIPGIAPDDLNADVTDQGGDWSIRIKDQAVKIGQRTVQLGAIREITLGSAPGVELASGQRLAGTIAGLNSLACIRNGKPSTVDLSRVQSIRLSRPAASTSKSVSYEVIIRAGGETIATQRGVVTSAGVSPEILRSPPEERPADFQPGSSSNLPPGVKPVRWPRNGHHYAAILFPANVKWSDAVAIAAGYRYLGKRGHLATAATREEAIFLFEQNWHQNGQTYWLGGYRDPAVGRGDRKGVWRWITGERWLFEAWDTDQPNSEMEECLLFYGTGLWHDALDGHPVKGLIVEFD